MKSIRVAALATFALWILVARLASAQPELKLADIIRKSIDAQGGLEKMRAIKTMRSTGKIILGGGQMEAPMITYMKRPGNTRIELSVQGQKIIEAFDGTTKWSMNPMLGGKDAQKGSEDETKAALDEVDGVEGPLVNYGEKGHSVELLGKEDVDGSMAYKLKVTLKSGNVRTIYLDDTTFLTVKLVTKVKQAGQEFEAEMLSGNYRPVEGMMMPFSTSMKVNKQIGMQMQIDKVEVNVPLEDSLFTMPEIKKVDAPKAQ